MDSNLPINEKEGDRQEDTGDSTPARSGENPSNPSNPPNPPYPFPLSNVPSFRFENADDYVNHPFFANFHAQNKTTWEIWQPSLIEFAELHRRNPLGCAPRECFQRMHQDEPDTPLNAFTTFPLPLYHTPGAAAAPPIPPPRPPTRRPPVVEPQPGPSRQGVPPRVLVAPRSQLHPIYEENLNDVVDPNQAEQKD